MEMFVCVCVCRCVHACMTREEPSFTGNCLIIRLHLRVGELLGLIEFANTNYQQPSNMNCQCRRFRLATSSKTVNKTICLVNLITKALLIIKCNNQLQPHH